MKVPDIQWKGIYPNADLIIGEQFTPSFVLVSEKVWGYWSIEKSLLDKNKIDAPIDAAIGIQGPFDDSRNYGYDILYGDGTGTKPDIDRYKKLYADLWAKVLDKKLIFQVYADRNRVADLPAADTTTFKPFCAYQTQSLTVGVEAFMQTQTNAAQIENAFGILSFADIALFGYSIFLPDEIIKNSMLFFMR